MASDKFIIGLRAGLPSTRVLKPPGGDSSDLFGLKTRQKAFFDSFKKSASSMINERSRCVLDKYKDFFSSKEDASEEISCALGDPGTVGSNDSTPDLHVGHIGDAFAGGSNVTKSAESSQSEEMALENSVEETSSRLTTPEHIRSSQMSLEDAGKCGDWKPQSENNPASKRNSPNSIPSSELSLKSDGKPSDWKPPSSRNSETASSCDSSERIPSSQVSPKSTGISNSFKSSSALISPTSSSKRASLNSRRSSQVSPKAVGNSAARKSRSAVVDGEFLANSDSSKQKKDASVRKKPSSAGSPRESVITSKQVNVQKSNAEFETSRKFIRNPITGQVTQISGFLNSKRVIDAHDISEGIKMSVIDADSTRLKKAAKIYVKRNPITGEGTELARRIHA